MRILCCLAALFITSVLAQTVPNFLDGRTVIVHLFEWKWTDIALECERFLGPYGFAGVQVSPPARHKEVWDPWRPWYERYQPVSYELESRSGSESEFEDMVKRCHNVGVLIYVDAVINHMAASNNDGVSFHYPDVPYDASDFNFCRHKCPTSCGDMDYNSVESIRNCDLVGLNDIHFGSDTNFKPNEKVAEYLNRMIGYGVAGFRVDAAKHMWPGDLADIISRLYNTWNDTRPYIYQEVIDRSGQEAISSWEYTDIGDVTEFKYCDQIVGIGRGSNPAKWFSNFGEAWGMLPSVCALVFVDNHDNQRGHGGAGSILTYKEPAPYKKALAFGMAWDYGTFRVMSSFFFDRDDSSPPAYADGTILSPTINPDGTCGNDWVCEHRWRQIRNMACFRNVAGTAPVENWWDNGNNAISFSRGNRAFFALNNEGYDMSGLELQTGLPEGTYCDVISGDQTSSGCSGKSIQVSSDGKAFFDIPSGEDSMIAIHVGAKWGMAEGYCHWESV